jgi:alanine racemase
VAGRPDDIEALAALNGDPSRPLGLHLKFNCGMQRLGFDAGEIGALRERLKKLPFLRVDGVCTHLSHGEDILDPEGISRRQMAAFDDMARDFPGCRHVHKSASLATLRERAATEGIGSRPGIALYGLPHEGRTTAAGVKPVLRWLTELIHVHELRPGDAASYGARWRATRPSRLGVVPIGYGDGYRRAFSPGACMLFRGRRVPVVGSVCMDYTLLDLTDAISDGLPHAGEPIVILGRQGGEEIAAADLAEWAGTIAYEVVTAISTRVERVRV